MHKPNILFIMCDQLRHDWVGYNGAPHVSTPNINRIAEKGKVFTQAITNSPVCAPARIALASGLRPHRLGAIDNHAYLPLSRPTYYQKLRDSGYHVGFVGKVDLAKPSGHNGLQGNRPWAYSWGFTHPCECEGKIHAGRGDPPNGPYTNWLFDKDPEAHARFTADYRTRAGKGAATHLHDSVVPFGLCEDDYIGQRSVEQLNAFLDGEYPWHLFVSFAGPHDPFDPAPQYANKWRDAQMPERIKECPENKPPRYKYSYAYEEETHLKARRQYTAYLEQIDFHIGKILDSLEASAQMDNTYIVFASDHGEMLGDHGRYTKSCPYESALRIPMAVAGPGIKPGTTDSLVELIDLNPTITDMASVCSVPTPDAKSLMPLLKDEASSHRAVAVSTHRGFKVLRTKKYKFVQGEDNYDELYDLEKDPDETTNLAFKMKALCKELNTQLNQELLFAQNAW